MLLILSFLGLALAADSPSVWTDVSASTVGKKQTRIGLSSQDYGLLKNVHVGTSAVFMGLGLGNVHAKVTAVQTPKFDLSIQAERWSMSLLPLGIAGGLFEMTPIGWTGSWYISKKGTLHFGSTTTLATLAGAMTINQIAEAILAGMGVDIAADLLGAAGDSTGLYAGGELTLQRSRFAYEHRFNERHSLLFASNSYVFLEGLLAAGVATTDPQGVEVQVGASARFSVPLKETFPSVTSLSWQRNWARMHLRVGLPLSRGASGLLAVGQAVDFGYLFGPRPGAGAPSDS